MLIIQIGLTIWAWFRGWKAFALIPLIVMFPLGFYLAYIGVSSQGLVGIDFWGIILLIIMIIVGKDKKQKERKDEIENEKI